MSLGMTELMAHLLKAVERTNEAITNHIGTCQKRYHLQDNTIRESSNHLSIAFRLVLQQAVREPLKPLRLQLAGVIDAIMPCLMREAILADWVMPGAQGTPQANVLSNDMVEYRRRKVRLEPGKIFTVCEKHHLDQVLDRVSGGLGYVEAEATNEAAQAPAPASGGELDEVCSVPSRNQRPASI